MTDLDIKKYKSELLRVQAAKAEMEYLIAQKMEEIGRIEANIIKQEEAEKALQEKMGK
jgi:hypothetical protein